MILRAVAGRRLDDGLAALFPQLSKTRIRRAIDWGGCRVFDSVVRVASRPLKEGDLLTLAVTESGRFAELTLGEADILFEDEDYVAIDKPAGVYCQRTPYQLKGTVEFAVGLYLKSRGVAEPVRVIHRLDRGTSGVMFFPKTRRAAAHVSGLLKEGKVEKIYRALVGGAPERDEWTVDAPIGNVGKSRFAVARSGKAARTAFRVLAAGRGAALVEARPLTGRTHQVRVHLAHGGLPIVGDDVYGGAPAPRMMLHCRSMAFAAADGRPVAATAPPDAAFTEACGRHGIPAAWQVRRTGWNPG